MIGDHFRALLGTHGVSRALVSRRTSKILGLAPEPYPLRPDPPLDFEERFLKNGVVFLHQNLRAINYGIYRWNKHVLGENKIVRQLLIYLLSDLVDSTSLCPWLSVV